MSPQKLILSQKYSITKIIQSCENQTSRMSRLNTKTDFPKLTRSHTLQPASQSNSHRDSDNALKDIPKGMNLKQRVKLIKSIDFQRSISKNQIDLKRLKIEPFCGEVPISKNIRPVFKQLIKKYKRNFHPSNASRGESNTSDDPFMKTPRKIRQMRGRYHTQQNQNQIRRLVVLNQVINQNNRREVRIRGSKSKSKYLHF